MKKLRRICFLLLALVLLVFTGCQADVQGDSASGSQRQVQEQDLQQQDTQEQDTSRDEDAAEIDEDGHYTGKDEVALYIHTYGHLPSNFISKTKARKAGWVSKEGNLDEVLPGMSIGGSEFHDYDEQLPSAKGRTWTECDINYSGGYRGSERIIFSNDGLIFYTDDHYETFEQLY